MPGWLLTRIMKLPSAPRLITTALAGPRPQRQRVVVGLDPDGAVLQRHRSIGRGRSGGAEATTPSTVLDPILVLVVVVAAAEDREARQREAEQPPPALADLGAVDHDDVAPLRRRLQRGGGGVEALQPRRVLGDRAAADQRLEQLGPRRRRRPALREGRGRRAGEQQSGEQQMACESCCVQFPDAWTRDIAGRRRLCASLAPPVRRRCGNFATCRKNGGIPEAGELLQLRFHPVKTGLLRWRVPAQESRLRPT